MSYESATLEDLAHHAAHNEVPDVRLRRYVNGHYHDLMRGRLVVEDEDDMHVRTKGGRRTQVGERHLASTGEERLEIKGPTGRFLTVPKYLEAVRVAYRDRVHREGLAAAARNADAPGPDLVPIDLTKCYRDERRKECPGIEEGPTYLARIRGQWQLGTFHRVHYGWSFADGWGASGHQFDPPGENLSGWEGLWRLEEAA